MMKKYMSVIVCVSANTHYLCYYWGACATSVAAYEQYRYIRFAMEKTGGKIGGPGGTAELLNMKRTTLQKRMKKLGIP